MTTVHDELIVPAYAPVTPLRAGPISLLFSNGDLRQLRVDGVEIVQRIYVAVRDQDWNTAPVTLHDLVIDDYGDHFTISFLAVHVQNEIGFSWKGSIVGNKDGSLHFTMDGRADTTFRRNRIGFCVLHPASAAGAPATLTHSDGSTSASQFPSLISPHQSFMDLRAITYHFAPGLQAEVSFEGDIFESEDQRNWTDASYKTYSTPLSIPYPVTITVGSAVRQGIGVRIIGQVDTDTGATPPPVSVTVGDAAIGALPLLGLGSASHGTALSKVEIEQFRQLNLSHLRVDLDLSKSNLAETLKLADADAKAIGASLEIALFVGENHLIELEALSRAIQAVQPKVARWLLFARYANITPEALAVDARGILNSLAPDAPIGGGTNLYFVHINRIHPPVSKLDFVAFSVNPQVHAFDLVSLVENMTAQPSAVESARSFSEGRPIIISPITLRARFNADAIAPEAEAAPGELPANVDARQPTAFTAVWTLGSISHLAQANVASLTYFETTGWRGIVEIAQGSPIHDKFSSKPGAPFPVYHLFGALASFAGGNLLPTTVSDPLHVAAIAVSIGEDQITIVGNLRDTPQRIAIYGLREPVLLQTLGDPAGNIELDQEQTPLWVDLAPYSLVSLKTRKT